eukprot:gene22072-29136_t
MIRVRIPMKTPTPPPPTPGTQSSQSASRKAAESTASLPPPPVTPAVPSPLAPRQVGDFGLSKKITELRKELRSFPPDEKLGDLDGSSKLRRWRVAVETSRVIKNSSKRREEYLIRWTGYGIEQDTWESAKEIDKKSPQIVTAWLQRSQKDRDYRTGSRSKRKNPST